MNIIHFHNVQFEKIIIIACQISCITFSVEKSVVFFVGRCIFLLFSRIKNDIICWWSNYIFFQNENYENEFDSSDYERII